MVTFKLHRQLQLHWLFWSRDLIISALTICSRKRRRRSGRRRWSAAALWLLFDTSAAILPPCPAPSLPAAPFCHEKSPFWIGGDGSGRRRRKVGKWAVRSLPVFPLPFVFVYKRECLRDFELFHQGSLLQPHILPASFITDLSHAPLPL